MTIVFVYGTLKRGHGNHGYLEQHRAPFLGTAVTGERFQMWGRGFPYIFPSAMPTAGRIRGELFRVNAACLRDLDRLEGNGHHYERRLIAVRDERGKVFHAEGYVSMRAPHPQEMFGTPDLEGCLSWPLAYVQRRRA